MSSTDTDDLRRSAFSLLGSSFLSKRKVTVQQISSFFGTQWR